MDYLQIIGGKPLSGEVYISGAKNASLPLLALSLLAKTPFKLTNIPSVADIKTFIKLLENLGARCEYPSKNAILLDTSYVNHTKAVYDIVRKMRASILVLGPLLSRFHHCEVSLPGGCAIGARPVDMHLKALTSMGAEIDIKSGYILARAPKGLKGTTIVFDKKTVTGSENIIMAAALAQGKTRIINACKEPEVVQLCQILSDAGLEIEGIGTDEISITGSERSLLDLKEVAVIPDRIEAGTYLCAGAITNSPITVHNVIESHMEAITIKLQEIGFDINYSCDDDSVCSMKLVPAKKISAFNITTSEFPGFPTDMQAQFMALATQCEGTSVIRETLFENRFMHVNELQRLGANISLNGNVAQVTGKSELFGTDVMATDLRASSALVLASLVAKGISNIHRIYHLDRGYENLEEKLRSLGADIKRLKEQA
ncbi:UDP-N-acetylglucosamine 1-carboxyvinyltransferase [Helicobacter sp. 13S00401-1]|uniref:UDP-N-acetylglucosamine 1-carboxyvinyltransferase n=1 Tax=Helicobacter sp. 13S00401-1 TaxID=1905758 RepID=UPI000BA5ED26|nr:UDP-N-acetylglucosamine 1-carboxyvinyltransferase [Helicobacter sp. 13S00401-1]PAF51338.1 UDP-N-acetylglucosamine 1-carboxyvinyltransferase [Helicobacter sp. 13S00401-1]